MEGNSVLPEIWFELGSYIHQDFLVQFPDFKSGIVDFCSSQTSQDLETLKDFISELLAPNASNSRIAQVWSDGGAQVLVDEPSARDFVEAVQDALETCTGN